jgi:hypothetical protein
VTASEQPMFEPFDRSFFGRGHTGAWAGHGLCSRCQAPASWMTRRPWRAYCTLCWARYRKRQAEVLRANAAQESG